MALRYAAILVAFVSLGCTYAPPIRGSLGGAPGRLKAEETEVTVAGSYFQAPPSIAAHVGHAVDDRLGVDVNAEYMHESSVMVSGGPRFTGRSRHGNAELVGDLEAGLGAGVGGSLCRLEPSTGLIADNVCNYDGRAWFERPAGGGYGGLGGAVYRRWFAFYARVRTQVSAARGVPVTGWFGGAMGPQFQIGRTYVHTGYVPTAYVNADERFLVHGWELGVTVKFGS
ncbi:MAG: hypothetical protein ACE37F_29970 [Nannocystaceae bacterium]|nr:hypothetical protein [bacterium]